MISLENEYAYTSVIRSSSGDAAMEMKRIKPI
jgi:hypothetical protein